MILETYDLPVDSVDSATSADSPHSPPLPNRPLASLPLPTFAFFGQVMVIQVLFSLRQPITTPNGAFKSCWPKKKIEKKKNDVRVRGKC